MRICLCFEEEIIVGYFVKKVNVNEVFYNSDVIRKCSLVLF